MIQRSHLATTAVRNSGVHLTFTQDALRGVPGASQIVPGTYRPTSQNNTVMPVPAPGTPYSNTLRAFNGLNTNGT